MKIHIHKCIFSPLYKYNLCVNISISMEQNIIYDDKKGINLICDHMSKDKYFIGRMGGVEFDAYVDYKINGFNVDSIYIKNLFRYCGYYDKELSENIFKKFVISYENYYASCDVLLIANVLLLSYYGFLKKGNPYYRDQHINNKNVNEIIKSDRLKIKEKQKISYGVFESFNFFNDYYSKLNGKKILIISPFENEIRNQLKNKDKLFTGKNEIRDFSNFKYPEFQKVEFINTYLTTNNYQTPHNNIIETFEYYKKQLEIKDFEIALLICGAYAYLFGDYIHNVLNKSCIHVGGIGQLFFGIKGGRYMVNYFEKLMNDKWIYPYTIIEKNAPGVPNSDGLLGYFRRKDGDGDKKH